MHNYLVIYILSGFESLQHEVPMSQDDWAEYRGGDAAPAERSRLYILLGWLHVVVLERLRYEPIGWSKAYEFSETYLVCAIAALDDWIDKLTQNHDNVGPNEIPWDALHKMLEQFVYDGRVDNKYDTAKRAVEM